MCVIDIIKLTLNIMYNINKSYTVLLHYTYHNTIHMELYTDNTNKNAFMQHGILII